MASKAAEIQLTTTTRSIRSRRNALRTVARALKEWGQRGQLGAHYQTELSRHTGSRI